MSHRWFLVLLVLIPLTGCTPRHRPCDAYCQAYAQPIGTALGWPVPGTARGEDARRHGLLP